MAKALYSPPSLDLWSLARARGGGPFNSQSILLPSIRGGVSREAARGWGFMWRVGGALCCAGGGSFLYLRISQSLSPSVRKLPILVFIHMLAESEQHLLVITDRVLRGT